MEPLGLGTMGIHESNTSSASTISFTSVRKGRLNSGGHFRFGGVGLLHGQVRKSIPNQPLISSYVLMTTGKTRVIIPVLLTLFVTSWLTASTDDTPHRSPCGRFQIVNVGNSATVHHHFELRRTDGRVLSSYRDPLGLQMPSFAHDITWSPDGEFVAVSVGTGKYLMDTLILCATSARVIRVETEDPDAQTRPVRWTRRGELVVETGGPYGGKVYEGDGWYFYRYRRTFVPRKGGTNAECVYKGPVVYPYRAQMRKEGFKPDR